MATSERREGSAGRKRKEVESGLTEKQVSIGLHEAYWKLERRVEDLEKRLGKT